MSAVNYDAAKAARDKLRKLLLDLPGVQGIMMSNRLGGGTLCLVVFVEPDSHAVKLIPQNEFEGFKIFVENPVKEKSSGAANVSQE